MSTMRCPFERGLAILIGIDAYAALPPLRTAVGDVRTLGQVLAESHGYQVQAYVDGQATLAGLRELLGSLQEVTQEEQQLLFYFAGHGTVEDAALPDGAVVDDGPQGFFLPQDASPSHPATWLPMVEVYRALAGVRCRHMLIVLDCCFAGAFRPVTRKIEIHSGGRVYRQRYERYLRERTWQLLTSASCDETALDHVAGHRNLGVRELDRAQPHSPFAEALLAGLRGEADINGDGLILLTELYLYIEDRFASLEQRWQRQVQRPTMCRLRAREQGEYLFVHPALPLVLPEAMALQEGNNPYRGLERYDEEHRELFFGRKQASDVLAERVLKESLTVLLGVSGCGKSSLLRAGVAPALREQGVRLIGPLRPSERPALALSSGGAASPEPAILVVDQLEEVVTLCHVPEERARFFAQLRELLLGGVRVVVAVRADFETALHGLADAAGLSAAWDEGRVWVPTMSMEELRAVIEGPAAARVLFFEPPELVDRLISEVAQMPGALPLLSFALSELYRRRLESGRSERTLLLADFKQLGGVIGSLAQRIGKIYAGLPPDREQAAGPTQGTMRRLLLRLISTERLERTRRQVPPWELLTGDPAEDQRMDALLSQLIEARLVVRGAGYVEAAHDALVRNYPELEEWVKAEYDGEDNLLLQRRLTQAAWDFEQKRGQLWDRDPRLGSAQVLARRTEGPLSRLERGFIERSGQRRRRVRQGWFLGVSLVITVLAAIAVVAVWQWWEARQRLEDAIAVTRVIHFQADRSLRTVAGAAEVRRTILQASAELMERLLIRAPKDPELLRAKLIGHQQRGDLALHVEGKQNLERASAEYKAAQQIGLDLTRRDPQNLLWQDDLSVTYSALGELAYLRGELGQARSLYEQDLALSRGLVARDPKNPDWQEDLSVTVSKLGEIELREGRLDEARKLYDECAAIRKQLVEQAPSPQRQRELAAARRDLALIAARQSRLEDARLEMGLAVRLIQGLLAQSPNNAEWKYDLAIFQNDIGRIEEQADQLTAAEQAYRRAEAMLLALVSVEAADGSWRRTLASVESSLGDVLLRRGALAEAKAAYQEAFRETQQLTRLDPANEHWQGDLAVAYDKLGEVAEVEGAQAQRLDAYGKALAILRQLAGRAPSNLDRKSELSTSLLRLGEIDEEEGRLAAARARYEESLALRQEVRGKDPGTLLWLRNVAVAQAHLGQLWRTQERLPEAEEAYRKSLDLSREVARREPGNVEYRNDLAIAQLRLGEVLEQRELLDEARSLYEEALAIREALVRSQPRALEWQRNLAGLYGNVGSLETTARRYAEGRAALGKGIKLLEQLLARQPGNAQWRREISTLYGNLGDLELAAERPREARAAYRVDYEHTRRLAEQQPEKGQWQRDLMLSHARQALLSVILKERAEGCQHLGAFDAGWAGLKRRGLFIADPALSSLAAQLVPVRAALACGARPGR